MTTRPLRRSSLVLVLFLIGASLVTFACGSSSSSTPATSAATTTTSEPATEAAPATSGADATPEMATTPDAATPSAATEPQEITVTDIVGRSVTVNTPVQQVILGEGRQLYIVAMLDPENPFQRVAAWRDDLMKNDLDTYNKYLEKFPKAADVPRIGNPASGEFSVEKAINLNPDVVLLNLDAYQGAQEAGLIDQLGKAGIPTVVIDFRQYPLENTVPSALLMGKLFGKEAQAQKFSDFYLQQINSVYARLDKIGDQEKPTAFLFRAAGFGDCCGTFGSGNLGLFIERAGGINLGSELLPGWSGTLNPETVISSDIDLIIVTGSNWKEALPDGGYVSFGYFTEANESRQQLAGLMASQGWSDLPSVQNGRVYAIWHQFYNSPYNFIALQQIAKWLYPDAFADLDPEETFKEFHDEFLPIDYSGAFWVSMN